MSAFDQNIEQLSTPEIIARQQEVKNHTFEFCMVPKFWDEFNVDPEDFSQISWQEIKYFDENTNDLTEEVKSLPNNRGGIYIFVVKSTVLPGLSQYLAYIGRARLTENHNLRVRLKGYNNEYVKEKARKKVSEMMYYYKEHLYLQYAVIEQNEWIKQLESELINALRPPFNDQIPQKIQKEPQPAF